MFTALLLAMASPTFAATVPAGELVVGAIHIDVTQAGFDALGDLAPAFAPDPLALDPVADGYEGLLGQCWLGGFEYAVENLTVEIDVADVQIIPQTGYLDVDITVLISINDAADPFFMYTMVECIESTCDAWIEPFEVHATTTMALEILWDEVLEENYLDATINELSVDLDLTGDDITLAGCPIGTVLDVFEFIGLDLIGLIIPSLDGVLNDVIGDFAPELEATIEDAFSAAKIDQEFEIQGATIHFFAEPSDILIRPQGLRMTLDGSASALEVNDCIANFDPGGSLLTDFPAPSLGEVPTDIAANHAANLLLADEFGNQALYALWRGGLLCFTVDEELGFPIDTSILSLLAGEAFKDLFPEARSMVIETRPRQPPTLGMGGTHSLDVYIDDLGLDFMASLDHRMARVLSMGLKVDAGIDLSFDGTTGELGVGIDLGADAIGAVVTSNDFVPEATENIEESFSSVFNGLVGGILGDALGGMTFAVPGIEGMGLTDMQLAAAGEGRDWLGGYAWLGEVSYASMGCTSGEGGGCGTEGGGGCGTEGGGGCGDAAGGCSGGGCSTQARSQRRWLWLVFPLALVTLRRRS